MKARIVILFVLLAMQLSSFSKNPIKGNNKPDPTNKYCPLYLRIDSLSNKGLYKSANNVALKIKEQAKAANDNANFINALLISYNLTEQYEENHIENAIRSAQVDISKSKDTVLRSFLHSIVAELYLQYYNNDKYEIDRRTVLASNRDSNMGAWDSKIFYDTIRTYVLASVQYLKPLSKVSLRNYRILFDQASLNYAARPTLADLLYERAIEYIHDFTFLSSGEHAFEYTENLLLPVNKFISEPIVSSDITDAKYLEIRLYQDILKSHFDRNNSMAYVDWDITRLRLISENTKFTNKEILYTAALQYLIDANKTNVASIVAVYYLAEYWNTKASDNSNSGVRWYKAKAMKLITDNIDKFPKTIAAKNLIALKNEILTKEIRVNIDAVSIPNQPILANVEYKNISKVYMRIYANDIKNASALNNDYEEYYYADNSDKKQLMQYLKQPMVDSFAQMLPIQKDYLKHSCYIKIPALKVGYYTLLVSHDKNFSLEGNDIEISKFYVSDIAYFTRKNKDNNEVYVVSRNTGKPLINVNLKLFSFNYDSKQKKQVKTMVSSYFSDTDGRIVIPGTENYMRLYMEFTNENDKLVADNTVYTAKQGESNRENYVYTEFFTDRAIYRPGQTIYFKGITFVKDYQSDSTSVLPYNSTLVGFYDVNRQKIAEVRLESNEFGSFSGSFAAPTGRLTGWMQIRNENGNCSFHVEEYKRPKFEVKMNRNEKEFKLNDSVRVTGYAKAYAGNAIDNAKVSYRVTREPQYPRWWWYYDRSTKSKEIAHGMAVTNADGTFNVTFFASPDISVEKNNAVSFRYTIEADVIDINGETHTASTTVNIGYASLSVGVDIPNQVNAEKTSTFPISSENLDGAYQHSKGTIEIYRLKQPDVVFRSRQWTKPDTAAMSEAEFKKYFPKEIYKNENNPFNWTKDIRVFQKEYDTKKDSLLNIADIANWVPGRYVLNMSSTDKDGNKVESVSNYTLFSQKAKQIPENAMLWHVALKDQCEPGETAAILIGTHESDVQVLYQVEANNTIIQSEWLVLNKEQRMLEIPVKESYRGNFFVHFVCIKNNEYFTSNITINVPYTNKMLDVKFETFRNKLIPGQKEEWKVKITGKHGEKIASEFLTTMYDASLDAFAQNNWHLNLYTNKYSSKGWGGTYGLMFDFHASSSYEKNWNKETYVNWPTSPFLRVNEFNSSYAAFCCRKKTKSTIQFVPPVVRADMEVKEELMYSNVQVRSGRGEGKGAAASDEKMDFAKQKANLEPDADSAVAISIDKQAMPKIAVRTNLNETAFFYPQLRTDSTGSVVIAFTAPESLTRWKIMGLAHSKDLRIGTLLSEAVTQKDLMVFPNLPRFLREGDTVVIAAKISNLSADSINGVAHIELTDASSGKQINAFFKINMEQQTYNAAKNRSANVSWQIIVPFEYTAITCKITAHSENFSDGEEHLLPILSNRMLVTETMSLPIKGAEAKTFTLDKLVKNSSATAKNHKLTLEFTSNPTWYAIQALPYLMEYPYECAEQTFSRLYANTIAANIVNSSPRIRYVFDIWKNYTPDALLSNLEKNQELKSVVLEETPWVLDAKDESQQKQRVALLFDINRMASEKIAIYEKLKKKQNANGAFSWFDGMQEDRYITQLIVGGFGHLQELGVIDGAEFDPMIRKAISYMDRRFAEDYAWLKRNVKPENMSKQQISSTQIQYLYARSFFLKKFKITDNAVLNAFNYYNEQASKYWTSQSRYMQGMIALSAFRNGNVKTASDIMASMKEIAIHHEELGMYWKDVTGGYYWYESPIETQALLIEAFSKVSKDTASIEEMQLWLLKQKQTNNWKSTRATADACYALLLGGGKSTLTEENSVVISVGKERIDLQNAKELKAEAGTGYIKTSWNASQIKPEMGNIMVEKKSKGAAWGALYWQYFEQMDKITPAASPLKIKKELYVNRKTDKGIELVAIKEGAVLHLGDKVTVRMVITSDRDMEYIHIKDLRAAGFEPTNVLSRYKYENGLGYYESTGDAASNFFISVMNKGTYVFEYSIRCNNAGNYSNGVTQIECMYAPEFNAHSDGIRVTIDK